MEKKAQAEAVRLLQSDHDMFEKYLKKPNISSVGFIMLSQQRDKKERSTSPVLTNKDYEVSK